MVLVGNKKENGKCINIEKIHNLCDEIEGRTERITMGFIKVSPKDNDDVNIMFHVVLGLFPRKEKFQRQNPFKKEYLAEEKACYLKIKILSEVLVTERNHLL